MAPFWRYATAAPMAPKRRNLASCATGLRRPPRAYHAYVGAETRHSLGRRCGGAEGGAACANAGSAAGLPSASYSTGAKIDVFDHFEPFEPFGRLAAALAQMGVADAAARAGSLPAAGVGCRRPALGLEAH